MIVAVAGDCSTTTAVAIAATWPAGGDVAVTELDPSGGSVAAWFDVPATPSLATIVATVAGARDDDGVVGGSTRVLEAVEAMTRRAPSGVRFVPAPARSRSAHRAVEEAGVRVVPVLSGAAGTYVADLGRIRPLDPVPAAAHAADVTIVAHRQSPSSASAEAVRLERLVEGVEHLAAAAPIVLAVIGANPFDPQEVAEFVRASVPGTVVATAPIADEALSAAVLAGRSGVSARRLARLPLMRTAESLARAAHELVGAPTGQAVR